MSTKGKAVPLSVPSMPDAETGAPQRRRPVRAAERWLLKKFLAAIGNPPVDLMMWDGEVIANHKRATIATLHIRDRVALYALMWDPNLRFGDYYASGRLEVEGDFQRFLEAVYRAGNATRGSGIFRDRLSRLAYRPRPNTLRGSKANIHSHYDIGNDFYKLWLDRDYMQYTCAYYPEQALTLEQAQVAKMEHVCRKLRLQPGETVVEAGCGWGGLARYMAKHHGVNVRSYNISHEQISFARARAQQEGLADRVEYVEDDYRNIEGDFDVFVSVGMLEHVGVDNYPALGEVIDRSLKDNGRGLIHSIGRNRARLMNGWIEKRIFPGAYPPTLREAMDIFEPNELSVLDVENLRMHYAKTLEEWLERYEANIDWVRETYDEAFVRAWRLYLAGSIAAFTTGSLQLFQILFARPRDNDLPWTRAHLYEK